MRLPAQCQRGRKQAAAGRDYPVWTWRNNSARPRCVGSHRVRLLQRGEASVRELARLVKIRKRSRTPQSRESLTLCTQPDCQDGAETTIMIWRVRWRVLFLPEHSPLIGAFSAYEADALSQAWRRSDPVTSIPEALLLTEARVDQRKASGADDATSRPSALW
jgi:hypothetical protein